MAEKVTMHDQGLQSCCGARFLAKFGNCFDWDGSAVSEMWDGRAGKARLERELKHKTKTWCGNAFLVAILNAEQWERIGKIFIDAGFKVVACGWSGGKGGSKLRLLAYINYEEDVEKDNAKKKTARSSKRKTGTAIF